MKKGVGALARHSILLLLCCSAMSVTTLTGCNSGSNSEEENNAGMQIISAGDNKNDTVGDVMINSNESTGDSEESKSKAESSLTTESKVTETSEDNNSINDITGNWCDPMTLVIFEKSEDNKITAQISDYNTGKVYEGEATTDNKTFISVKVNNYYIDGELQEITDDMKIEYSIKNFSISSDTGERVLELSDASGNTLTLVPYED